MPDEALREALLNALCHKQYESCVPIQVSIYEDQIYIANCCNPPSDLTVNKLFQKHTSRPYNKAIANVFYLAGLIENWGRGIEKICHACKEDDSPPPEYIINSGDIMIRFTAAEGRAVKTFAQDVSDRRYEKLDDREREVLSLLYEDPGYTVSQMADILNIN